MIPKLITILLLAIEHTSTEETTTIFQTQDLSTVETSEQRNVSSIFTADYSIPDLDQSLYQIQEEASNCNESDPQLHYATDDRSPLPLRRYERKNNHSQKQEHLKLDNRAVKTIRHQQKEDHDIKKSNELMEFEFEFNERGATGKNSGDSAAKEETNKNTSSILKQIFAGLFPQRIDDLFRFSYVAQPQNVKRQVAMKSNEIINPWGNRSEKLISSQLKSSLERPMPARSVPLLPPPLPSMSPTVLTMKNVDTSTTDLLTKKDVDNINEDIKVIIPFQERALPKIFPDIAGNSTEPINLNNRVKDNFIVSSEDVLKLFYAPPDEMSIHTDLGKQLNGKVIENSSGDYGQTAHVSSTRQLDDFHEKVEKQFNPNYLKAEPDVGSRIFLKKFNGRIERARPMKFENKFEIKAKITKPESLLHTYIFSPEANNNSIFDRCSTKCELSATAAAGNPIGFKKDTYSMSHSKSNSPESMLHTYIFAPQFDRVLNSTHKESKSTTLPRDELQDFKEAANDTQHLENQEYGKLSLLNSHLFSSQPKNSMFVARIPETEVNHHHTTTLHSDVENNPRTLVEIQKSVNIHNKLITEKNGNLIEQHEIYTRPNKFYDSFPSYQLFEITTLAPLSEYPIRVAQADDSNESESIVEQESARQQQQQARQGERNHHQYKTELHQQKYQPEQYHQQDQKQLNNTIPVVEKLVHYPVEVQKIVPQPYPVETIVEKYIDRPVHTEHVVEKQVKVPYPVQEIVEKIVDRPVHLEKIIDRPVHIPYAIQVDHFVDRPYAVQVPVAVAVPVPVPRYIDRPYPVEKIVEKPIHVPYPVEKVVEKVVEKHVPVEVERIVEKPIEKIIEKQLDRPYPVKKIIARPIPIHIPIPVGISLVVASTKSKDFKNKSIAHKTESSIEDFLLVPPPFPMTDGGQAYKTLPENIDVLFLDDDNGPIPFENQYHHWTQPVKRGTKPNYIKRSPEFRRNLRVEYGFKPPLVPSLEINDQGLPLESQSNSE